MNAEPIPPGMVASADQYATHGLALMDQLAAAFDCLPIHQAAHELTLMVAANIAPDVLAAIVANLALATRRHVRSTDLPGNVAGAGPHDGRVLDAACAGVEIRVIGPKAACATVLARIDRPGVVPLYSTAGPMPATRSERPNDVRFYAYTDSRSPNTFRSRDRSRSPRRRTR